MQDFDYSKIIFATNQPYIRLRVAPVLPAPDAVGNPEVLLAPGRVLVVVVALGGARDCSYKK